MVDVDLMMAGHHGIMTTRRDVIIRTSEHAYLGHTGYNHQRGGSSTCGESVVDSRHSQARAAHAPGQIRQHETIRFGGTAYLERRRR